MITRSIEDSRHVVELCRKVRANLDESLASAKNVNLAMDEIAIAANRQREEISPMNSVMREIATVTQSTAAQAQRNSASSTMLSTQAETVDHAVEELAVLVG